MMIPFTRLLVEIIRGWKSQTTRIATLRWYQFATDHEHGRQLIIHLWWQNPRHRRPTGFKIGETPVRSIVIKPGTALTRKDAARDGFTTIEQYLEALGELHGMTRARVLTAKWALVRWENLEQSAYAELEVPMGDKGEHHCPTRPCDLCEALKTEQKRLEV